MNSSLVGERQMPLIAQRRKWTRNLSLLCKEEGEELQVFLSREYKGEEEKEKFINKKDEENKDKTKSVKKGGSLRGKFYKNEEKLLKESLLEENNNIREGKYWNSLGDFKSEKINDGDDDSIEQIQIKESSPRAQEIIRQCNEEHCQTSQRLLNEESKTINLDQRKIGSKRGGGMFLAVARILGIGWRRRNGRERDEKYWNYNEEPTLLDSDWHRPGEVIKFRSKHKGAELRPRLSDLSGLRSNSVFTPINTSAGNSRHPSNQWSGLMRKK
uniref:Uncharacterized protein n=1 Tax=Meloidogyne hapla TaxID=6305 RepID=A0A1I8BZ77_MELHA